MSFIFKISREKIEVIIVLHKGVKALGRYKKVKKLN